MKIDFFLRFHTIFGQTIAVSGNLSSLGNNDPLKALSLTYLSDDYWHASIEITAGEHDMLAYRYYFIQEKKERKREGEKDRIIDLKKLNRDIILIDTWNDESYYENTFYTAPFTQVFFREHKKIKYKQEGSYTHTFKVKAPLLAENECICLVGGTDELGNWDPMHPVLLHKKGNWWTVDLNFSEAVFPISYKYGVYHLKKEAFVRFEEGDNRVLNNNGCENKFTIIHDGFARLPNTVWKGAGVAIPVFSLRSNNSFGVGEFTDIKLLVDWACETGLKLIQLLPVNDTSATFTWKDSYPYAAISAFALHPLYINLQKAAGKNQVALVKPLAKKQKSLNQLAQVDYEQVMEFKMNTLRELFENSGLDFLKEKDFLEFYEDNKSWLVPYACFCSFRDKYGTSDFSKWKTNSVYHAAELDKLCNPKSKQYKQIAFYFYIQFHLHLQLKEAAVYAHKKGIAFKGDIPIGIYRYGCDAWTAPELYNLDMQAGAPPDDFTIKGQNWGFPTYNWKKMEEDQYEWWRQRFHQMATYFDAFRIDHILGFFRIWSIPIDSVEGILGRFIPALPVDVSEFGERGIWFNYNRYCKPYITDAIIENVFGASAPFVKDNCVLKNGDWGYDLKSAFDTQSKVAEYFSAMPPSDENEKIKQGLFDLITNVLLYEEPGSGKKQFHFRILIELTSSFQQLEEGTRHKLKELYIDYFYRRQDEFWRLEAMKKLPALKHATDMLVCGEDLGMVPHCVPDVMKQLAILSLEIQRMPKDINAAFFHPKDAPYLSVITPSTHDMSTVRGWWEENREKTQRFYETILHEHGAAPYFCEPWISRAIILQHLYSPAMWGIFQLQDILGMNETLRREKPSEERINDPANPDNYWNYRMHLNLEQLIKEKEFNSELKDYITNSGRS